MTFAGTPGTPRSPKLGVPQPAPLLIWMSALKRAQVRPPLAGAKKLRRGRPAGHSGRPEVGATRGAAASAGAPPSEGLGAAGTAVAEPQAPGAHVRDPTEKTRRCPPGAAFCRLDLGGSARPRSASLPLPAARRRGSRGAPPPLSGTGDAVGRRARPGGRRGCAAGARRLRARPEAASPVPGLPESARPAAAPSPRKRLTARARPGALRPASGAGRLGPRGRAQPAALPPRGAKPETRFPARSRKSDSGNAVPYLPAQLPPLTSCAREVGAQVIMQTSGAVLRRGRNRPYSS